MFGNAEAFCSFSVNDVQEDKLFYGETLGLKVSVENDPMSMLYLHVAGGRSILVYLPVEDIDKAVDELGVRVERYEETDEKGMYRGEGPSLAWFKDPTGNLLSVMQLA